MARTNLNPLYSSADKMSSCFDRGKGVGKKDRRNLIGKPAGLYRNVGEGVKEFFYEVSNISLRNILFVNI